MCGIARLVLVGSMAALLFLSGAGAQVQAVSTVGQWVTPLEMDFGPVGIGASAQQMVATITNSGSLPLTGWTGGAVSSPFNGSQDCNVQGGLLPGKSCHFYYTFTPTTPGPFSATSSFSTNAGSFNVKLQGRADAPYNIWVPALRR